MLLRGSTVSLRPLTPEDAPALLAITPTDTFRYFLSWPDSWSAQGFADWIASSLIKPNQRPFAVILNSSNTLVGSTSYLDISDPLRHLEIGCTWYTPNVRGTAVNPEAKLLLLDHAFGPLNRVRVTLKCDARNAHSQAAIAKLGATREGTLRKHRIQQNGFIRDTVYFSITQDEWPTIRPALAQRIQSLVR